MSLSVSAKMMYSGTKEEADLGLELKILKLRLKISNLNSLSEEKLSSFSL